MSATRIEWADVTVNPIVGCSPVSPACQNCYARAFARRLAGQAEPCYDIQGDEIMPPNVYNAYAVVAAWDGTLRWRPQVLDAVLRMRKPRRVFWCSMSDIFHENVKDEWLDRCFAVMALTPHLTHFVLTKRMERMAEYVFMPTRRNRLEGVAADIREDWSISGNCDRREFFTGLVNLNTRIWPLPNVRLGVTAENQEWFDRRVAVLMRLAAQGWRTFVSLEPCLSPMGMTCLERSGASGFVNPLSGRFCDVTGNSVDGHGLTEVFVGCETGTSRRPTPHAWLRSVVDQCRAAGVRCLVKAMAENEDGSGKVIRPGSAVWPRWVDEKEE